MIHGERLKEARKQKGYSQQELGELLGVSKVSICSYEKGTRNPNMKNFLDLLQYLEVDPNYLLGRDIEVIAEGEEPFRVTMAREDIALIRELKHHPLLYRQMTEEPKRTIELIERKLK